MSDQMSKEEFRSWGAELKNDIKQYLDKLEKKIDLASENITTFTKDIALLERETEELKKSNSENWKITRDLEKKTDRWTGGWFAISVFLSTTAIVLCIAAFFIKHT